MKGLNSKKEVLNKCISYVIGKLETFPKNTYSALWFVASNYAETFMVTLKFPHELMLQ